MTELYCPYCGSLALFEDSARVYGRSYGMIYICSRYPACDAFVGAHKNSGKPKGTLANRELRDLRKACHARFDPVWKSGRMRRKEAYAWLAEALGIAPERCHIGMFGPHMCRRVLELESLKKLSEELSA